MSSNIPDLQLIVGYDQNRAIGFNGDMPWGRALPADLQNFRRLTMGNTVIMGRKTFDTIGRALPGRKSIVLTRNPDWAHEGVEVIHSLEELRESDIEGQAYVMGGAQVYHLSLPYASKIYATEVATAFDQADTYLDAFDPKVWYEARRAHYVADEKNAYDFDIVEYERRDG